MLPSVLTEDTGCWPDPLRTRSLFPEDRALHQSLAHQQTLLRQDSSDVSLPTGAHTSSPVPLHPQCSLCRSPSSSLRIAQPYHSCLQACVGPLPPHALSLLPHWFQSYLAHLHQAFSRPLPSVSLPLLIDHPGESCPSRQTGCSPKAGSSSSELQEQHRLGSQGADSLCSLSTWPQQCPQHLLSKVFDLSFQKGTPSFPPALARPLLQPPGLLPVIPESEKPTPPPPLPLRPTAGLGPHTTHRTACLCRRLSTPQTICPKLDLVGPRSHLGGEACSGL